MRIISARVAAAIAAAAIAAAPPHALPVALFPMAAAHAAVDSTAFKQDGADSSPLLDELLRRTATNADKNAAIVKGITESNAFQAVEGRLPPGSRPQGRNCAVENCGADARPAEKLPAQKVAPMDAMKAEFTRVRAGLTEEAPPASEVVALAPVASPIAPPPAPPAAPPPADESAIDDMVDAAQAAKESAKARLLEIEQKMAALSPD